MPFGPIIATRELTAADRTRPVLITIGKPRRHRTGEWACPFRITGVGRQGLRRAFGEDAMQALQLAFEAIRVQLEASGRKVTWEGSPLTVAFPRSVPYDLGPELASKLDRIIDREVRRTAREYVRRGKATLRKEARARKH